MENAHSFLTMARSGNASTTSQVDCEASMLKVFILFDELRFENGTTVMIIV
jgi:hypothetical protein